MWNKKKYNVIIRTEGGSSIGMGHLVRCLALADMLKYDFNISFAIQQPNEQLIDAIHSVTSNIINLPETDNFHKDVLNFIKYLDPIDIAVLDGYNFKTSYQKAIKEKGKTLVCIDDLHAFHFYADAIINVSDSVSSNDYSSESYTRYFLGSNYALLRDPFLNSSRKPARIIKLIDEVFISMGGTDINNITLKILKAIQPSTSIKKVHIVIGSVNLHEHSLEKYIKANVTSTKVLLHKNIDAQELNSLICDCQIAICPASGISLEAVSVGVGIISGYTADNQLGILNGLVKKECILNAGDFNKLSVEKITKIIEIYISNIDVVNEMVKKQKKLIDGLSPQRFISIFNELCK